MHLRTQWHVVFASGLCLAAVSAGCDKKDGQRATAEAAAPEPAPVTVPVEGDAYAELEHAYQELAGSAHTPDAPWAAMARQMGTMRELMSQGGAMGPGMMGRGGGMMMRHGMSWQRACGLDQWNRDMAAVDRKSAEAARASGDTALAGKLDALADKHDALAKSITSAPATPVGERDGAALYARTCAPCHRPAGEGVPGAFPPLRGDPVVLGPDERLIRVVSNGLRGPLQIGNQRYFGVMPAFSWVDDASLAAILTHVRASWGHTAAAVTAERVGAVRKGSSAEPPAREAAPSKK